MYESRPRYAGVLLPISSLPGPFGIGSLGRAARGFADFLAAAKVSLWQILPLGPTGYGNSPYAARSSFAGNELFIDPEALALSGLLSAAELSELAAAFAVVPDAPSGGTGDAASDGSLRADYGRLEAIKLPLLKTAARRFVSASSAAGSSAPYGAGGGSASGPDMSAEGFAAFCAKEAYWLDDYALFQVLCETRHDARWHTVWDVPLARREAAALKRISTEKAAEILDWKILQYFFECQWQSLKTYVNSLGIRIIGDIPIFAAPDSADTWTHLDLFRTGPDGTYSAVSGVPPDYFSPTGQLWGNPVYDWEKMKASGYRWWIDRVRRLLSQVDMFRIDHFRGFDEYWAVPAGEPTAEYGVWEKGPGEVFFAALTKELGELPVLAEDLGFLTEGVKRLRDSQGFPGMKVCQFGFEDMKDGVLDSRHLFLPHNYSYHWAAYTGTHDNNTTAGWYAALGKADKDTVAAYLNCGPETSSALPMPPAIAWAMIRSVMASHAQYAIFPLQDLLGLGAEARINTPATCGPENWSWRLPGGADASFDTDRYKELARRFASLVSLYSRTGG